MQECLNLQASIVLGHQKFKYSNVISVNLADV